MTLIDGIKKLLYRHEGYRRRPYRCTAGKLTIGIGRNIEDAGVDRVEAMFLLMNDIQTCMADLVSIFPDYHGIGDARKAALVDMRFNLGASGFRSFRNMIAAVKQNDWRRAALEMMDSRWYNQVGSRAGRLTEMMETGKWPEGIELWRF